MTLFRRTKTILREKFRATIKTSKGEEFVRFAFEKYQKNSRLFGRPLFHNRILKIRVRTFENPNVVTQGGSYFPNHFVSKLVCSKFGK